jgi:hypothetical protein
LSSVRIEPLLKLLLFRFIEEDLFCPRSIFWEESNLPNCINCWLEIRDSLSFWIFWAVGIFVLQSMIPDTLLSRFSIFLCMFSKSFYFPLAPPLAYFTYLSYFESFKSEFYFIWSNERWKPILSMVLLALIRDFFMIWGTGCL